MSLFSRKTKILVVEDEADIAEGLKARLELEGYDVLIASDGTTGVQLVHDESPSLIILDVMLPVIDGYEICKVLKKDNNTKKIPILILTALPHVEDAERAFAAGADDFLNKPYSNDRLLKKIAKLLPQ